MSNMRIGVACGCILATIHLVWAGLVAIGWAQPLMDFIFWLHMLNAPFQVQPFSIWVGVMLVGFTWMVGFLAGFIFATIWKKLRDA